MNSIERNARMLLEDMSLLKNDSVKLERIIVALTPPEGYVLVPVEPTEEEVRAVNEAQQEFFDANTMSMFFSSGHYNEESIRHALRAVRTARPEAPNVND